MLKLGEFIKKIRECKTAQEERALVNKESADIRNMPKDQQEINKILSLKKCLYMTLLGYHTEFIQMTCIGLLASSNFAEKRLAYLGIPILLDENSEILLLISHTIKKDLLSPNHFIVGAALNLISEICSTDMCRDFSTSVIECLKSSNPYIKKKACLCLTKIIKKCPELLETAGEHLNYIFDDKNHGVLLSGLALAIEIFKIDFEENNSLTYIKKNKKYISSMIKYLKNLSNTNYSPEYDINGITDPFLQAKLIKILKYFDKIYKDDKDDLSNVLASLTTNTDNAKSTGNAILYEVVKTIISLKDINNKNSNNSNNNSSLLGLASNILGKFLGSNENNLKYIALNEFQEFVKIDKNSIMKHKNIIFDSLKDNDISIKRRSLDLIYKIINQTNIQQVIKVLLNFLLVCENEFKLELTDKITQSLEKYSSNLKYEIDSLIKMLCLAGNFVTDKSINSITNLIIQVKELHVYSMFKLFIAMKSNLNMEGLICVGMYSLGELYSKIININVNIDNNEIIKIDDNEIINLIQEINLKKFKIRTQDILINCYFKLYLKNQNSDMLKDYLKKLLEISATNFNFEIQERATEYLILNSKANDEIKNKISENIPNAIKNKSKHEENDEEDVVDKIVYDKNFEDNEDANINNLIKEEDYNNQYKKENNLNKNNNISNAVNFDDDFIQNNNNNNNLINNNNNNNNQNDNTLINNNQTNNNQPKNDLFGDIADIFGSISNNPVQQQNNIDVNMFPAVTNNNNSNTNDILDLMNFNNTNNNNISNNLIPNNTQSNPFNLFDDLKKAELPQQTQTNSFDKPIIPLNQNNFFNLSTNKENKANTELIPKQDKVFLFKTEHISIFSDINKSEDNSLAIGNIYLSNDTDKIITNAKIVFLSKKSVNVKIISTSGDILLSNQSFGIKKELSMKNLDTSKEIVIKIKLTYTVNNNNFDDTYTYHL